MKPAESKGKKTAKLSEMSLKGAVSEEENNAKVCQNKMRVQTKMFATQAVSGQESCAELKMFLFFGVEARSGFCRGASKDRG